MRWVPILAAALGLAAAAQPAAAAVVAGHFSSGIRDEYGSVDIRDPEGGRNDIQITRRNGRILIRERGPDTLREKGNCRKQGRRLVSCPPRDSDGLHAQLGPGDDALRVLDGRFLSDANLSGGRGDDLLEADSGDREVYGHYELYGDSGRDTLLGSRFADRLYGGRGRDRLRGGGGRDLLHGDFDAPFDDLLDGGRGRDRASWEKREAGIRVDLDRDLARGRGERDVVRSIESVTSGTGDDVLLGDAGPNRLHGRGGKDVMIGRAGDDLIDGGRNGFDPDDSRDHIGCGPGRDTAVGAWVRRSERRRTDALPQSCERHELGGYVPVPRVTLGADEIEIAVACWFEPRCRGRVTVSSGGEELGRSVRKAGKKRVTLRAKLAEPLRRGPPLDVAFEGEIRRKYAEDWDPFFIQFRLRRPREARASR